MNTIQSEEELEKQKQLEKVLHAIKEINAKSHYYCEGEYDEGSKEEVSLP